VTPSGQRPVWKIRDEGRPMDEDQRLPASRTRGATTTSETWRTERLPGPAAPASTQDLRDQLVGLLRYVRTIVLFTVLGVAAGVLIIVVSPERYESTVTFFVASPSRADNVLQADEFAQRRINSYVGVIRSERMAEAIVDDTVVPLDPKDVSRMITASADPETVLLRVSVTDVSPERSELIAASIAENLDSIIGELDNRGQTNNVQLRVISGPTLNPDPVSPRKKLTLGIGLLLGLALGVAQAMLRHQLDDTMRSRTRVAEVTGLPNLATITYDRSAKSSPIMPADDRSLRGESFRQLRTSLRFVDAASPIEVLVVTSSVEGEGKTSTAGNLAHSFAASGRKTIIVDADLRKPRLERYLDVDTSAGLTTVLIGDASLEEVVQRSAETDLDLLATGPLPPNPSELLGSEQMERLITQLRDSYDMVIIDTPPLGPVTDAALLSTHADGVLLAVRYGKTKVDQVRQSVESLEYVDARTLGTVLTMVPTTGRKSYYTE